MSNGYLNFNKSKEKIKKIVQIFLWLPVYPIAIFKYRTHVKEVLAFISRRHTISELQTPETL